MQVRLSQSVSRAHDSARRMTKVKRDGRNGVHGFALRRGDTKSDYTYALGDSDLGVSRAHALPPLA
jgi:hypothetical protein